MEFITKYSFLDERKARGESTKIDLDYVRAAREWRRINIVTKQEVLNEDY